jgi:hypothetical protein
MDKKKINDTLVVLFDALPAPVIDFGDVNGVLNDVTLPHILDAGMGNKSYLWQDNSTLQIFEVLTMGEYSVTVTGENDCQTSKTVKVNMPNGLGELWNETGNIEVYPNPSNGLFRIVMNSKQSDDLTVRILNNQGQIVYLREFTANQLANDQINVQEFPNGMYHIIIQSDEKIYRGKIVIQ